MRESPKILPGIQPVLDPDFVPAALWNRSYQRLVENSGGGEKFAIALERRDGSVSLYRTRILPQEGEGGTLNQRYVERVLKFLLWQRGGFRVYLGGDKSIGAYIRSIYSADGARSFDYEFMGEQVYGRPLEIRTTSLEEIPEEKESSRALGGHFDGCRIGFDLGGSDRKCAAVVDGEVVHSEEVPWDPYFQEDPQWHLEGIDDSLQRAAAKLPRVDAIGGSAAGVYVDNEVRVASIFRGVSRDLFDRKVRNMFHQLARKWKNIPFVVVNDGEVTALAGSLALGEQAVLGLAMGTSLAAGYVTPQGRITNWLNELAFAPVDFNLNAPADEWSGDVGVGAQYFSQQAVGRLAPAAGIELPEQMALPEKLVKVQDLMESGDERAQRVYETIGVYLGYSLAHYSDFYQMRNVLVLGRVMTGRGGQIILAEAQRVLISEFPELHPLLRLVTPGEKEKRHGQAVAAASLPAIADG